MLKFIMFKEDDSYCKSLPPLKLENLYNKIVIPLKKPFLNLCCYHLFEDIKKEKAIKLFEILVQVGAFTDLEYALQYY